MAEKKTIKLASTMEGRVEQLADERHRIELGGGEARLDKQRSKGKQTARERIDNLVQVMDGYFDQGAHHLNVNVFGTEKLIDAMEHPEKEEYANFTIRVSGYAVKFIDLTREQQMDVISRTCHATM